MARFDGGRLAAGSSVFGLQRREADRLAASSSDDVRPSGQPLTALQLLNVRPQSKNSQSPSAWPQAPALEGDAI